MFISAATMPLISLNTLTKSNAFCGSAEFHCAPSPVHVMLVQALPWGWIATTLLPSNPLFETDTDFPVELEQPAKAEVANSNPASAVFFINHASISVIVTYMISVHSGKAANCYSLALRGAWWFCWIAWLTRPPWLMSATIVSIVTDPSGLAVALVSTVELV